MSMRPLVQNALDHDASGLITIYLDYLECVNERRLDQLGKFVADELVFDGKSMSLSDYRDSIRYHIDAVPDFHWDAVHVVTDGDTLAARLRDTGRPVKSWLDIEPNGRSIEFIEWCFYRFRDAKIIEVWVLLDIPSIQEQLGQG